LLQPGCNALDLQPFLDGCHIVLSESQTACTASPILYRVAGLHLHRLGSKSPSATIYINASADWLNRDLLTLSRNPNPKSVEPDP
jgi:hypothetical protein